MIFIKLKIERLKFLITILLFWISAVFGQQELDFKNFISFNGPDSEALLSKECKVKTNNRYGIDLTIYILDKKHKILDQNIIEFSFVTTAEKPKTIQYIECLFKIKKSKDGAFNKFKEELFLNLENALGKRCKVEKEENRIFCLVENGKYGIKWKEDDNSVKMRIGYISNYLEDVENNYLKMSSPSEINISEKEKINLESIILEKNPNKIEKILYDFDFYTAEYYGYTLKTFYPKSDTNFSNFEFFGMDISDIGVIFIDGEVQQVRITSKTKNGSLLKLKQAFKKITERDGQLIMESELHTKFWIWKNVINDFDYEIAETEYPNQDPYTIEFLLKSEKIRDINKKGGN